MSKRLFTIVFAVYYLCLSIGVNVSAHYCSGDLIDWSLQVDVASCEGCDSGVAARSEEDSCCKEKHQFVKKTGDDLAVQQWHLGFGSLFALVPERVQHIYAVSKGYSSQIPERLPEQDAPPGSDPPSYILFGNFRV